MTCAWISSAALQPGEHFSEWNHRVACLAGGVSPSPFVAATKTAAAAAEVAAALASEGAPQQQLLPGVPSGEQQEPGSGRTQRAESGGSSQLLGALAGTKRSAGGSSSPLRARFALPLRSKATLDAGGMSEGGAGLLGGGGTAAATAESTTVGQGDAAGGGAGGEGVAHGQQAAAADGSALASRISAMMSSKVVSRYFR